MRMSRREMNALYELALSQRDEARRERDNSRDICRGLAEQVDTLRKQLAAAQCRPDAGAAVATEGPSLAQQLELSERARRSLAEQLATVQASNDVMCRDAVTAAGTLAPVEVTA